ncbi:hypothetical protein [Paractinoplanes atraurantiacus]|nr:hypothetical protein [Actinoplanes atraurantiacus]
MSEESQERRTTAVSPWMLPGSGGGTPCWSAVAQGADFSAVVTAGSVWVVARLPGRARVAVRVAHCPHGHPRVAAPGRAGAGARLLIESAIGVFHAEIDLPGPDSPLHVTTALRPHAALTMPFWPRDLAVPGPGATGRVHAPPGPDCLHFSITAPGRANVHYRQNLAALDDYARQTGTSLDGAVGGRWPELGLALPGSEDGHLEPGHDTVLSDAYLSFQ